MKRKEFINNRFFHLFIILIIGALTYLPFLGRQGFYRDDWYQIWAGTT